PYAGTPLELADLPSPAPAPAAPKAAATTPAKPVAPAKTAAPKRAAKKGATAAAPKATARPAAFTAPGAPAEPLDEVSLPERAKRLSAYVAAHPKPSDAAARHWLYQHTWIVTGARFGWWHGAQAL